MKTKAKILQAQVTTDGKKLAKVQFNTKLPPVGTIINVQYGSQRSLPQNSLYWAFLSWLIDDAGLRDQCHFSQEALHMDLKSYFLAEKILTHGEFRALNEPTTTEMNKTEFSEYFEKVEQFAQDFFKIDTAPFWRERDDKPTGDIDKIPLGD